jgi:hypothetical protein
MQDWQNRVVEESDELVEKLNKLSNFIDSKEYDALPNREQDLLFKQHRLMREYADVLAERLRGFKE